MSEIIHDASQPLSTISCLLEVALLPSRPVRPRAHEAQLALQLLNSVVGLFRALQELVEAGNLPQDQQIVPLTVCLREVVADLLPAADRARAKLSLTSGPDCLVSFQVSRLRQAFSHLIEFALDSSAPGAEVKIGVRRSGNRVRVSLGISAVRALPSKASADVRTVESKLSKQRDLKRRLGWAVASHIFERAGCGVRTRGEGKQRQVEVLLPWMSGAN